MLDKTLVSRRFSEHAADYDQHARVQRMLGDKLVRMLGNSPTLLSEGARVLEIGSGTGGVTRQLLHRFPAIAIDAVDLSPGMVQVAQRKVSSSRARFLCGDIEEIPLTETYAAIVSNATFQWLQRPAETVRRLLGALFPGGLLAFSTLADQTFHELRASFEEALRRLKRPEVPYPGLTFMTTTQIAALVKDAPGLRWELHEEMVTEPHESVRAFLRSVKRVGATGSASKPTPPMLLLETERVYRERFGQESRVSATYHCVWVVARTLPDATVASRR